jgi:hypothetical protein
MGAHELLKAHSCWFYGNTLIFWANDKRVVAKSASKLAMIALHIK